MSSSQSGVGDIHRLLIEADLVERMVALQGRVLYATQIHDSLQKLPDYPFRHTILNSFLR
jgi:hypothetical protein